LPCAPTRQSALARQPARQSRTDIGRFAAITGGDTFAVRKPHGDHVLGTIEMAGGPAAAIRVMIGDSINDILAPHRTPRFRRSAFPSAIQTSLCRNFNPVDLIINHFDELRCGLS
jgi:phosphoglycolate phosphatase